MSSATRPAGWPFDEAVTPPGPPASPGSAPASPLRAGAAPDAPPAPAALPRCECPDFCLIDHDND